MMAMVAVVSVMAMMTVVAVVRLAAAKQPAQPRRRPMVRSMMSRRRPEQAGNRCRAQQTMRLAVVAVVSSVMSMVPVPVPVPVPMSVVALNLVFDLVGYDSAGDAAE